MPVVHIDTKRHGCPENLQFISSADERVKVCALKSGPGCSSAKFMTHNVSYSKVRGYAYGQQVRTCCSFDCLFEQS